jgi:hypothetical protein
MGGLKMTGTNDNDEFYKTECLRLHFDTYVGQLLEAYRGVLHDDFPETLPGTITGLEQMLDMLDRLNRVEKDSGEMDMEIREKLLTCHYTQVCALYASLGIGGDLDYLCDF